MLLSRSPSHFKLPWRCLTERILTVLLCAESEGDSEALPPSCLAGVLSPQWPPRRMGPFNRTLMAQQR